MSTTKLPPLAGLLQEILLSKCQLDPSQQVVLGVSGGADSLALLDLLWQLGHHPVVAHLDHGLRPNSAAQARAVQQFSQQRQLPFAGQRLELAGSRFQGAIEERARAARYQFLFSQAKRFDAQAVMVAHNADDQVETILMHLLRGAGLDGLAGMPYRALPNPWSDRIPLLRPLLGVWRQEIEAYLQSRNLAALLDESNWDTTFFRNRLRHELLPDLNRYVPAVQDRLWQTADLLAADLQVMKRATQQAWQAVRRAQAPAYLELDRDALLAQPLGLRRRLVREAVADLVPAARDIDYALVERLLAFSAAPTETLHLDIGLGLGAWLEDNSLFLAACEGDLPRQAWPQVEGEQVLSLPGSLIMNSGWRLVAEQSMVSAQVLEKAQNNSCPEQAWFDLGESLPQALAVRPRRPGDRFRPLGMAGHSLKLSDFMINQKMPRRARPAWPLVCYRDTILWIPGQRPAGGYQLTPASQTAVFLQLQRQ
ncbi:MAG: tRNA lysidine(34) synthetase TilS [Anaerolineales bacterium]|nr:tRNA lysidine(34) synthetase TilS [Anaerolineales bacterium]